MNELLKALHDYFYKPLPETKLKQEVEDCHRAVRSAGMTACTTHDI